MAAPLRRTLCEALARALPAACAFATAATAVCALGALLLLLLLLLLLPPPPPSRALLIAIAISTLV